MVLYILVHIANTAERLVMPQLLRQRDQQMAGTSGNTDWSTISNDLLRAATIYYIALRSRRSFALFPDVYITSVRSGQLSAKIQRGT